MKITLVGFTVPGSGVKGIRGMDNYIYQLGKNYVSMGHDAKLIVRSGFKPNEPWVKTVYSPGFSWMAYPYFLSAKLAREKSDVFHSDYITTGVSLLWSRRRPAVVSIHDVIPFSHPSESGSKGSIQSRWYFRCFNTIRKADALIVMSENAKKEAIEFADVEKEKLHVVYNGVDQSKFYPIKRADHEKIRIGYLGGLDGRKNVVLLVEAFKELAKSRDDIELHVGGTGTNLDVFRGMKIPNATFHGFIPDEKVNEFYNSLDIFVFPSLAEGFGNMAVEAMAAGTPIIVANRTSLPEIVGDAGTIAEPDTDSLVKSISKLADSVKLRKRHSEMGIKRAGIFTWENCADNTLNVYSGVIGDRAR
jgi:glycosyltransferase involved in cell wall biosynthesis